MKLDLELLQVAEEERRERWRIKLRNQTNDDVKVTGIPTKACREVEVDQLLSNKSAARKEMLMRGQIGSQYSGGTESGWKCSCSDCATRRGKRDQRHHFKRD